MGWLGVIQNLNFTFMSVPRAPIVGWVRFLAFPLAVVSAFAAVPPAGQPPTDGELLRKLAARVEQLEKELAEIKSHTPAAAASAAPADESYPRIRFSGFADLNYHATHRGSAPSGFGLGEMDLFITSRISEKAGVIVETVIGADETNNYSVDIERLIFQYTLNEHFKFDVGRFHTALGYYNTAFHHGTWFQAATGRPDFLNFEDRGGILPVHMVGLSVHGDIPAGRAGLGYFAEVGNNHQFRDPASGANPVANTIDVNTAKAFNFALVARPEDVPGLQFGAGVYRDMLRPDRQRHTQETILHGHAVFKDAAWEFIAEAYRIRHATDRGPSTDSTAWFAQLSRQFGPLRPFVRYSLTDIPVRDLPYSLVGLTGTRHTTSAGLRWDFTDYAAYKIQIDQKTADGAPATGGITLQVALTF